MRLQLKIGSLSVDKKRILEKEFWRAVCEIGEIAALSRKPGSKWKSLFSIFMPTETTSYAIGPASSNERNFYPTHHSLEIWQSQNFWESKILRKFQTRSIIRIRVQSPFCAKLDRLPITQLCVPIVLILPSFCVSLSCNQLTWKQAKAQWVFPPKGKGQGRHDKTKIGKC